MKKIDNGVLAPKGFIGNGVVSGIRKKSIDLCIIYSPEACNVAGVFTKNLVKAAPVLDCIDKIKKNKSANAIVINSGNANACTGLRGQSDASTMCEAVSKKLLLEDDAVYVCSTGVIGVNLPMPNILNGINTLTETLGNSSECAENVALAIMTTDTKEKEIAFECTVNGNTFTIGGIAKGSGMIHPNMGTMLSFITTDVAISDELLEDCIKDSVARTYNMISVDGDTSTNDTCLVLANGQSKVEALENTEEYNVFREALNAINEYLAKSIVADGEGATKTFEVSINNAISLEDARLLAKSIVSSSLVKTAIFGNDANFGRILCAMGYSDGWFNQDKTSLFLRAEEKKLCLFESGTPLVFSEELAKEILEHDYIYIDIELQDGKDSATAWGCDLSYEYVKINGAYRS